MCICIHTILESTLFGYILILIVFIIMTHQQMMLQNKITDKMDYTFINSICSQFLFVNDNIDKNT